MIREGSNTMGNLAAALLYRPIDYTPAEIRKISDRTKKVYPDEVWKFISKNKGCNSDDVADYLRCSKKIAIEHLGKLHKNNRVIRRGKKGQYTYEAIK